eukprot:CAMPEP_0170381058 /NCGR_PEP_ID=MMETSP0117_2-20130122/14207_1 /TAXON_ID=400756 /ORGANISM="Durinskia baltica, Strain CSIRO CS-38" /LENGTH=151 /DNA_ID=CAMNT_0010636605 /DNA_START=77 /DNA_END=530 /DNA_ORIENTATION=-
MKLSIVALAAAFAKQAAATVVSSSKSGLDINQKVYIENQPVLGDGAGEGILNVCQGFARQHVDNPGAPEVKVCGTGIKATFFLRNRCQGYYEHQQTVGKCDSGMPSTTAIPGALRTTAGSGRTSRTSSSSVERRPARGPPRLTVAPKHGPR